MSKAQKLSSVTVSGTTYKGHPSNLYRPQTPPPCTACSVGNHQQIDRQHGLLSALQLATPHSSKERTQSCHSCAAASHFLPLPMA